MWQHFKVHALWIFVTRHFTFLNYFWTSDRFDKKFLSFFTTTLFPLGVIRTDYGRKINWRKTRNQPNPNLPSQSGVGQNLLSKEKPTFCSGLLQADDDDEDKIPLVGGCDCNIFILINIPRTINKYGVTKHRLSIIDQFLELKNMLAILMEAIVVLFCIIYTRT